MINKNSKESVGYIRKKSESDYVLQNYRMENSENQVKRLPYEVEKEILTSIKNGDVEKFSKINRNMSLLQDYSIGVMAHNKLKHAEYSIVAGIALVTRAAIEGGMNPYDAYEASDLFLQRISLATKIEEYNNIMIDAELFYCKTVKGIKAKIGQSIHIEKCKAFISRHLNENFTVKDIASHVGLSENYLSGLFCDYEHQTLKSYILESRIAAAENMLKYSDVDIAQVGTRLCFSSQSYFGAVFKKYTGLSPATYRKLNKPQGF